jgi:hypothetical protein
MKILSNLLFLIAFLHLSCSEQNERKTEKVSELAECTCIDEGFSSSKEPPFAKSKIGSIPVLFCGYNGSDYKLDSINSNRGFKRTGFEVISCKDNSSIFSVGEYYTDSIVINQTGFSIYQLAQFPTKNQTAYSLFPILKFSFNIENNKIVIDTSLALNENLLSKDYLSWLEKWVDDAKLNKEQPTIFPDLNMHYLFLRAIKNSEFENEFISSGPYDGYMGPIFSDLKSYLKYK